MWSVSSVLKDMGAGTTGNEKAPVALEGLVRRGLVAEPMLPGSAFQAVMESERRPIEEHRPPRLFGRFLRSL